MDWQSLAGLTGDELEAHYRHILAELGKDSGLIPTIFRKAQNKVQDPAKLRRLIALIDEENWVGLDIDVKGDIYEGLLEKNAQEIKSGADQYFTPRPLIRAMVDVKQPRPGQTLCDPAAGTGIFYAQGVKANVLFFDRKPASGRSWTETLWIYDLRTNKDFTLKQNPLARSDLDEFVACYHPANRHTRTATWSDANPDGRWRDYPYEQPIGRDKANLDIFWLRDDSLEDSALIIGESEA